MRHLLTISEQPAAPSWPKNSTQKHLVSFEYAVRQPVDDLAERVVTTFIAQDKPALTQALKAFTDAGYDPSALRIQGDFEYEQYSPHLQDASRSLLQVALLRKSPKTALMKILVSAGCDPFDPHNFAAQAIIDEKGPGSKGRQQWAWLLEHTPVDRWLCSSVSTSGSKSPQEDENYSLVHHAIRFGKVPVVQAMVQKMGLAVLNAQGPSIFDTLDQYHAANGSPETQRVRAELIATLREPLIALEKEQLRAVAEGEGEVKPGTRARL